MAASAPIQFTVDQEALLVADTNVARERPIKKRGSMPSSGYVSSPAPAPRPMYMKQNSNNLNTPNGVPTPVSTPPPGMEIKKVLPAAKEAAVKVQAAFKADADEGLSPKALATEPVSSPPKDEELLDVAAKKLTQDEDKNDDSEERENDIYADAVLACSIENPESCLMCSG